MVRIPTHALHAEKAAAQQRAGKQGEAVAEELFRTSALLGLGVLRKRPTNVVVVGGEARHTAAAGCDYHGHLRGGRAVYVEVKRATSGRLPCEELRQSQRDELARAERDGAIAVVLVLADAIGSAVYALPWRAIEGLVARVPPKDGKDARRKRGIGNPRGTGTLLVLPRGEKSVPLREWPEWKVDLSRPLLDAAAFRSA